MRIAIVGTGYVGLVTGACFAEFGFQVTCIDQDAGKIDRLLQGQIPIYEPGLESLVAQGQKNRRLQFTTDLRSAVAGADIVLIAVGTPSRRGDGHADLKYVFQAAQDIAGALQGYTVVVTKSTVPVGTSRKIKEIIQQARADAAFDVASNPEFLREGSAINDFMRPDRVVIGVESARAQEVLQQLYRPLYLIETPIVCTGIETAELIKYAGNGFLAMKIAFINQIADLCEKVGGDVQDVARGIGLDGRIGRKFLHVGPGYGGSCFPKDTLALVRTANEMGAPITIIEAAVTANDQRKLAMVAKIRNALGGSVKGKKIAILGVTFKPNTDDMRDAPSLVIIPELVREGAIIQAYDPVGMDEAAKVLPGVTWTKNSEQALIGSEAAVILTEWNEFRALDFERIQELMARPLLIDLRNIYKPNEVAQTGFEYISIGRPEVLKINSQHKLKKMAIV